MQLSGKLNVYLADIDETANEMFEQFVKQMAKVEGITEQLKSDNQMEWIAQMNNIRQRVTEIILKELIIS